MTTPFIPKPPMTIEEYDQMLISQIEFTTWPVVNYGGQRTNGPPATGVMAIHNGTGLSLTVDIERSQLKNKTLAVELLLPVIKTVIAKFNA